MSAVFEVTLLGVNSALPVYGRHPSCQIVTYADTLIMIDCGEGTQSQLSRFKIKRSRINTILISHMHGDHCFGLPGILTSFSLQQRKEPLTIYGPTGIKRYVETILEISGSYITYPLEIIECDTEKINHYRIHPHLDIITFPLDHRIPTMGFRIDEVDLKPRIDGAKILDFNLEVDEIISLKSGKTISKEGVDLTPDVIMKDPDYARSYVYCSDTAYKEDIIPYIKDADTIYHETTYLGELRNLADERKHTTLEDAIKLALKANIPQFISGHYSSRYKSLDEFLNRGKKLLKDFSLGIEGNTYSIKGSER